MPKIKEAYCPGCDEDLRLGVETGKERWVVVCGCDEAQTLDSFVKQLEGVDGGKKAAGSGRAFQ